MQRIVVFIGGPVVAFAAACTLLVDTDGLSGGVRPDATPDAGLPPGSGNNNGNGNIGNGNGNNNANGDPFDAGCRFYGMGCDAGESCCWPFTCSGTCR